MKNETKWSLDQAHSEIAFKVRHFMISNVKGSFKTFEASIYTTGKDFTTAVIDEASQILEPQLIGLLPKVGRFLLIGDHKQLPAITVQPVERSRLPAPELLHTIGLLDRRGSFFERLLRCSKTRGWSDSWGMLSAQGRMHEVLARFPNHAFYGNQLTQAGLAHQQGELSCPLTNDSHDPLEFLLSRQRIVYVPSTPTPQPWEAAQGQQVRRG